MQPIKDHERIRNNSDPVREPTAETRDREQPALRLDAEVVEDRIAPAATDRAILLIAF